jgi:U3 small nucleolar RNA-associated protein 7
MVKPKFKKPIEKITKFKRKSTTEKQVPHKIAELASEDIQNNAAVSRAKDIQQFNPQAAKHEVARQKLKKQKTRFEEGIIKTAEAQILNVEDTGYIKTSDGTATYNIKQSEIRDAVDLATASKSFELLLEFGPYRFDYGINGRDLIIGGRKGHVGVIDWMTKDLVTEKNTLETVNDVSFLHVSTIYATAQRRWVHIYDEQGVEMHCMKKFSEPKLLEFLPRHLLLVCSCATGFLHYLDVTSGNVVASYRMKDEGNPHSIARNNANGIIISGGSSGQVSMWSPMVKESLVSIKAHTGTIRGIAVENFGNYFVTAGNDQRVKLFDMRTYKQVYSGNMKGQIASVSLSQKNCLAVGFGQHVQMFENVIDNGIVTPYLSHFAGGDVRQVQFCPHEDILGIGHARGFSSIIVPGSGDPDVSGLIHNPFESKAQRREREVKMLLDKLQPEMIALDPSQINRVKKQNEVVQDEKVPKAIRVKPDYSWPLLSRFKRY